MDVVEFFSGIGGMRLALSDATKNLQNSFPLKTFKAIDTSELVNQVYRHNFSNEEPWKVNIETIKVKDLEGKANIWTMSPPCQPFTTTKDSKQLHSLDPR
jgi:tRNA (cytosine38-C5)-methyltransferase